MGASSACKGDVRLNMTIINTKLDPVYVRQTTLKPPESSLRRAERELPEFYQNQIRKIPTPDRLQPHFGKKIRCICLI